MKTSTLGLAKQGPIRYYAVLIKTPKDRIEAIREALVSETSTASGRISPRKLMLFSTVACVGTRDPADIRAAGLEAVPAANVCAKEIATNISYVETLQSDFELRLRGFELWPGIMTPEAAATSGVHSPLLCRACIKNPHNFQGVYACG